MHDAATQKPREAERGERSIDWLERAAVGASLLCLIHCLGLPLLFAMLPVLSRVISLPERFHIWVLAFAIPTASIALAQGAARHHRWWPLVVGVGGLACLATGALVYAATAAETWLTVAGSIALSGAHIANWRLRHAHA